MEKTGWIMVVVGVLFLFSAGTFPVGFMLAIMGGFMLFIYYKANNVKFTWSEPKRDPSDIPLEEKGETYFVEYLHRGDLYYDSATVIRGVYKPGRTVTVVHHGEEKQCKVGNRGYGYFVEIDGREYHMRSNRIY